MKRFKVISPEGFAFGGRKLKQGETFTAERFQGHVTTGLHFGQIKEVDEAAEEAAQAEADAKAKEAALEKEQAATKAKEEADAKAKAEADAKAKNGK